MARRRRGRIRKGRRDRSGVGRATSCREEEAFICFKASHLSAMMFLAPTRSSACQDRNFPKICKDCFECM